MTAAWVAAAWVVMGCSKPVALADKQGANKMDAKSKLSDDDFKQARYPTYASSPASPEVSPEFRGVAIRLPRKAVIAPGAPVTLAPDAPLLPVAGVVRLPDEELEALHANAIESVVLVFVNQATGQPVSFNLRPDKIRAAPAPGKKSDEGPVPEASLGEVATNYIFNQYFNIDVFMFCRDFPRTPARYNVHALLGKHKSQSVPLEITAK